MFNWLNKQFGGSARRLSPEAQEASDLAEFPPLYSHTFLIDGPPAVSAYEGRPYFIPDKNKPPKPDAHGLALKAHYGTDFYGNKGYYLTTLYYDCDGTRRQIVQQSGAVQEPIALSTEQVIEKIQSWHQQHIKAGHIIIDNENIGQGFTSISSRGGKHTRAPIAVTPQLVAL